MFGKHNTAGHPHKPPMLEMTAKSLGTKAKLDKQELKKHVHRESKRVRRTGEQELQATLSDKALPSLIFKGLKKTYQ